MFEPGEHAITKDELIGSSKEKDLLIDFYADWCGPCKLTGKRIDLEVMPRMPELQLVKVNCDITPRLAAEFGVTSIPTLVCCKGGKVVAKFVGAVSSDVIVSAFGVEKTETITVDMGLGKKG